MSVVNILTNNGINKTLCIPETLIVKRNYLCQEYCQVSRIVMSRIVMSRIVSVTNCMSRIVMSRIVMSRIVSVTNCMSRIVMSRIVMSRIVCIPLFTYPVLVTCRANSIKSV